MDPKYYERIRARLYGGHVVNPFQPLAGDRSAIRGPLQGTPEEFSRFVYEMTHGDATRKTSEIAYKAIAIGKRHILKFRDGRHYTVTMTKGGMHQLFVVVTPFEPTKDEQLHFRDQPLSALIADGLGIKSIYALVASDYRREERLLKQQQAAEERKLTRESSIETTLATIERAKSGETIMIRGMQNIDELVKLGFAPSLVDNPDNWIDAEDMPGLQYHHAKSGIEVLLTGREKFRPIEELSRLELHFLVHRNDDDRVAFDRMRTKYRRTKRDGTPYPLQEFHDDLIAIARYPDELKDRTEEDLDLMADEVEHVIDRRRELDSGILPYEAVFARDTEAIVRYIVQHKTPRVEIGKALDYFEYTGMIDAAYKEKLFARIETALVGPAKTAAQHDVLQDKRVKEIVAAVLKKLSKEQLTPKAITLAMAPYVTELGFGRLVKIRERILRLKELMHQQNP